MIGEITEKSKYFIGSDYLDISEDLVVSRTDYPELYNSIKLNQVDKAKFIQEINNPTPGASDYFGASIAVFGDTMIVGAYLEDTGATNTGSAYVYTRAAGIWSLEQEINNPSPVDYDYFGTSVSIYGDTIIIGAYTDDTGAADAGSAYVYTRSLGVWSLEQEINNPSPTTNDYFGRSVAIYGDTVVIGAYNDDTGAADAGSVYVYTRTGTTWTLEQEINNSITGDYFGYSVAIYEDTLVIGALGDDTGAADAGAAYVYTRSTGVWTLEREINNPSPVQIDYFGHSVAIYQDTVVIGAYNDDTGAADTGAAYVYTRSTGVWTLEQEINNPSPGASDYFGYSVAVYQDIVVIGAYGDDTGATDAGSAYVYTRAGGIWSLEQEINNPFTGSDRFGYSVAVYDDAMIVGAYLEDTGAADAGSIYVYDLALYDFELIELQQEINNPSPVATDWFGASIAVYGDTMVVGAYLEDTGADSAGSVYVYTRSSEVWTLEQEINNPSPVLDDRFGSAVAVYGDTLVVGAVLEDTGAVDAGSVYVYTRTAGVWTLEQEINNPTPVASDWFGSAVSVYNDTVVIGAYLEDTSATDAGSVYVYVRSAGVWSLEQEINNPNSANADNFGISVAVHQDTLVIGAHGVEVLAATDAGAAYVYTRSAGVWTSEQEIFNPTPVTNDYFGYSVAVHGDTVVIGAYTEDTGAVDAGSAYVYTRTGNAWSLEQEINNPGPVASDWFGYTVSVYADTVVIGANGNDEGATDAGSVYVYTRSSGVWILQREINNPSPVASDYFGTSVSIYGDTVVIGAYREDTGATDAGSAYVYVAPEWGYGIINKKVTSNPTTKYYIQTI